MLGPQHELREVAMLGYPGKEVRNDPLDPRSCVWPRTQEGSQFFLIALDGFGVERPSHSLLAAEVVIDAPDTGLGASSDVLHSRAGEPFLGEQR